MIHMGRELKRSHAIASVVVLELGLVGCGSGTPARPEFPAKVAQDVFAPPSRSIVPRDGEYAIELAGMHVADGGVYLYAYVCGGNGADDERLRASCLNIGERVSSEPSPFVEVVAPDGSHVGLLPYERPTQPRFGGSACILFGTPPVQPYDATCKLQTFVLRTEAPLDTGPYLVRFTERCNTDPELKAYGALVDTEFRVITASVGY